MAAQERAIIDVAQWMQGCEIGGQAWGMYSPANGISADEAIDITLADSVHLGDYTQEQVDAWRKDPDFNDGAYSGLNLEVKRRRRDAVSEQV